MNYEKLFALAEAKGLDGVQVTTDSSEALNLTFFNGAVEKNEKSAVSSCLVSAFLKGQKAQYKLEDLDMDEAKIVDALYDIASHMSAAETSELFAGSDSYPTVECARSDFHDISILDKIALLASVEQKIRERESRVVQIPEIEYEEEVSARTIVNTKGLSVSKRGEDCALVFELVASDGKDSRVGFQVEVKKNLADFDVDAMVDEAIRQAVGMFGASPVESGEYPVIIENQAMVSLLAAFSGMFGGESALKKISPLQGKLGEKVFSEKITVCDLPLKEDAITREAFDDEGVACYDKTVVDKGVFTTMLHNLKTAKAFGTVSTGNAFRGSVAGCNLCLMPGERTKEELIASVDRGLLLTEFDGLHAGLNAISGDMSLKTEGYLIENGAIVRPVTLIVLAGNFLSMMNDVAEVGSDLKLRRGVGAPSVKFNKVSISG